MSQAQRIKAENLSIIEIESIDFLESRSLDFALLATTETMKTKGIMDATRPINRYLARSNFHNYDEQESGGNVTKNVTFITESEQHSSTGSFYRAGTRGDRRLNLSGFWDFAVGNEIILLIVKDDILHIINISKINLATYWKEEKTSVVKGFFQYIFEQKTMPLFDTLELDDIDQADQNAIEGAVKELKILARKRNKKIADACKKRDKYTCRSCDFHYRDKVVECHHLNPLSVTNETTISLKDLVTLCPTCHSIAHHLLRADSANNINVDNLIINLKEAIKI